MSFIEERRQGGGSDIEERRRDDVTEKLQGYKREVAFCETTIRAMHEEEARVHEVYNMLGGLNMKHIPLPAVVDKQVAAESC